MPKSPYYGSVYFGSPYFKGTGGGPQQPEFEAYAVTLRELLAELIQDGIDETQFIFNNFTLVQTWRDYKSLEELEADPNGRLYLIAYPFDSMNRSRTNMVLQEVPVLIGYKKAAVKPDDTAMIDRLVSFLGQVEYVCRKFDPDHYSYLRTEALKDEDGLPYCYTHLTNAGLFESYFVVYYNLVVA